MQMHLNNTVMMQYFYEMVFNLLTNFSERNRESDLVLASIITSFMLQEHEKNGPGELNPICQPLNYISVNWSVACCVSLFITYEF